MPFVDAGDAKVTLRTFELSVLDCLRGLQRAISLGWYSFDKFDLETYEKRYKLSEGDMNWVIPGRIMALSSPVSPLYGHEGARPQKVAEALKKANIKRIIRLNEKLYDEKVFGAAGITVEDMEFPDGSCPSLDLVERFITMCDSEPVAVHCKAGLGRTGTLIACYLINREGFKDARSVIGWLRIARPGSVVGL